MFPLLFGAIIAGAGTAFVSKTRVNVDVNSDQMVARAIEMLGLREKLDLADSALRDTLLELRMNSAELTAQGMESLQSITDDLHGTLACVRVLLLVVGVWYVLRMTAWAIWMCMGVKEKKHEPTVILLLGSGAELRALSVGALGTVQAVCA